MNLTFFGANGAAQAAHSGNTCFVIREAGHSVLIDAAGDPVMHLERAGVSLDDLDALVLTHRHTDHIYALPSLFHNMIMRRRRKPLTVVGNTDVQAFSRALLELFGLWERMGLPEIDWCVIEDGEDITTGPLRLTFFDAPHSVSCHGFVAEAPSGALVYSADGGPNPRIEELAVDVQTLIHDATDCAAQEETLNRDGHSSARQAGLAARTIGARTLFLSGLRAMSPEDGEALRREALIEFSGDVIVPIPDKIYGIVTRGKSPEDR